MIDIHCHLNFHSFKNDYDEVIKRAFDNGVTTIVNVGTKLDSSRETVKLANEYENLWAIVGVHPHHADKIGITKNLPEKQTSEEASLEGDEGLPQDWVTQLEEIALHPKVIGIGECGMDYYSYQSNGIVDPKLQRQVFIAQIELAYKLKLPLQIHHRQVGMELINILKEYKSKLLPVPGMFHCFAGSKEFLKEALNLGFFIGFDGNLTYPGLAKGETVTLSEIAKLTPLDRIVCETDSPFLTPIPHRKERNEPQYVTLTAKFLADLKEITYDEIVEKTTENVYTVFTKLRVS